MSPRRKISADEPDYFAIEPKEPIRWGLPIVGMLSALLIAAAIAGCTFMLVRHESDERTSARDADALAYVTEFMKGYMTRDPFHANDFADDVLRQATGDFAKMFKDKQDEITVRVAQAEPS